MPRFLLALAALGLAAACNTPMVGDVAPQIVGADWVEESGSVSAPAMEDKWLLVQFFAPT